MCDSKTAEVSIVEVKDAHGHVGYQHAPRGITAAAVAPVRQERIEKPSDIQVGGNHYKDMVIQPSEFIHKNRIPWNDGNVIKYVCRHRSKNGAEDIKKAIHYLQLILEWEYSIKYPTS